MSGDWQKIEWPSPCGVCVITRGRLVEMGLQGEFPGSYLLVVIPFNEDDDGPQMWIDSPERLRVFVRMASPAKFEIKHAADEDVTALREYCLASVVH